MTAALEGLRVLVTGASGGIGSAIVRRIAFEGAKPIIHCGRDVRAAQALQAELGGTGWVVQADLGKADGAARLWSAATAMAGRIHGLVNNAGLRTETALDAGDDAWHAAWQLELQVNLVAAAELSRAAVAHFREHGPGRIVNIASRAGQRAIANNRCRTARRRRRLSTAEPPRPTTEDMR